MSIYNKTSLTHPWVWNAAEREYGKPLLCAVDISADIARERIEWVIEQNMPYYFVRSFVLFFEHEADGIKYHLVWGAAD